MKLGFFTMPMHPPGRNYTQTLKEDREAILLCDRLGFEEAYIGEHVSDECESIPSCLSFIASVAHDTKRLKLGSGTVNLPNHHPAEIAAHVAMVDHLLEGRFLFGIGPGGLRSDMEVMGNLEMDRNAMFVESIDQILKLWAGEPPYDIEGKFWKISTRRTLLAGTGQGVFVKPFQKPHPPIVVTAIMPASKGLTEAAARNWAPISANFLQPGGVATHWPKIAEGHARMGREADWRDWRVAKSVFVADDEKTAKRYAGDVKGPYGFYYWNLLEKRKAAKNLASFKADPAMPDEAVTVEYLLDTLVLAGTAEQVAEKILALRKTTGPFGTLLYCGHDWADPRLARRSMELMATEVLPRVNRALGEPV